MSDRDSLLFKNSVAEVEAVIGKVMLTITVLVGLLNPGEGVAIDYAAVVSRQYKRFYLHAQLYI